MSDVIKRGVFDTFTSDGTDPEKIELMKKLMDSGLIPQWPDPSRSPYGNVLTPSEEAELESLCKDRVLATKAHILDTFRKLPNYMRQFIVDSALWTRAVSTFNDMAPKTERQIVLEELQYPNRRGQIIHSGSSDAIKIDGVGSKYATIRLNEDIITADDLMMAHAEQCIEEGVTGELQKNQTEST